MKKYIISLFILCGGIVNAQGPLSSDSMFLGFHINVPPMDTVDESDTFYMFNPRPDSGLHFRVRCHASWNIDDFDTLVDGTPYIYDNILPLYNAIQYHSDNTVQLYGIAVTGMPSIYHVFVDKEKYGTSNWSTAFYDWNEPFDFYKEATAYRVQLLDGSAYDSGLSNIMNVLDEVWLDSNSLIKKCWFKYYIDWPDTDTLVTNIGGVDVGLYYPGRTEVVVPCYEFYFDNPFDSTHLVEGNFYVGRRNRSIDFTYYLQDEMNRNVWDSRSFQMREYYPYYIDSASSPSLFLNLDTLTDKVIGSMITKEKTIRPWGLIFPITGLRCGQLHNVQLAEKGEAYVRWTWQGGEDDDDSQYQVRLIDNNKGDGGIIASDFLGDTSYMFTNLDEYGDYTFKIRKRCHYATTRYDTVVWSDWYSYPFKMKENPVDTTIVDTTIVDTTIVDTTGIRLALGDADFSVSPNPVHGSAVVRLQYAVTERGELTLYDMRGREVLRRPLERGMREVRLDLEGLPAGAYVLKLLTPRGLCSQRLLVQ